MKTNGGGSSAQAGSRPRRGLVLTTLTACALLLPVTAVSATQLPKGRLTADGRFDTTTTRATRTFQRAEGVAVTGVVNAATRGAMYLALRRSAQGRG
jgi:peptidoglycan hydrolase-like protein with peptidoglycan-binding domain